MLWRASGQSCRRGANLYSLLLLLHLVSSLRGLSVNITTFPLFLYSAFLYFTSRLHVEVFNLQPPPQMISFFFYSALFIQPATLYSHSSEYCTFSVFFFFLLQVGQIFKCPTIQLGWRTSEKLRDLQAPLPIFNLPLLCAFVPLVYLLRVFVESGCSSSHR